VGQSGAVEIRTFERGVEAETLACGTGAVAAAVVATREGWAAPPVEVVTRSGETLVVDFLLENGRASEVRMEGPARVVFRGEWRPAEAVRALGELPGN
jgi:diaminopimelate epimerase